MNRSILSGVILFLLFISSVAWGEKTLVVCDDVEQPPSLNPYQVFSEKAHTIVQQVVEGLVRFTPSGEIEPALAEDLGVRVKDDRMRFKLRRGVRFHNGEPFDAQAVKFSIERYVALGKKYPGFAFLATIKGVDIIDPYTVEVVTHEPDGLLLHRLAAWVHIVPPAYFAEVGDEGFARHPVGTGAFRFESWEKDRQIVLAANREYWFSGHPKLDRLVFKFVPAADQADALLKGDVDLVTELPGTMTAKVQASGQTRVDKQQTFWTVGASMNTGAGPLADVRVRKAMNLAIDRAEIVRYDARGNGKVLASLTMQGQRGHNPDLKPYPLDVAEANRLLDEAGVKRPLKLKTLVKTQARRTAQIIKVQLEKIGVELDIQAVVGDAEALAHLDSPTETWDIAIGAVPDPMRHSAFIYSVLLFEPSPFSLCADQEFNRLFVGMAREVDEARQDELGRDLDRYVHEQAMSLFTYQKIKTYGVTRGVTFTPYISGIPYFFDATAEPKE